MKAAAKAPNLGQSFAHLLLQVARHRVDFLPSIRIGTMLCHAPAGPEADFRSEVIIQSGGGVVIRSLSDRVFARARWWEHLDF